MASDDSSGGPNVPSSRGTGSKRSSTGHYCCSFPGCTFRTQWEFNLVRHGRTHDPNRQKYFQCPNCPKQFDFKCNLQRHLETIHRGEKTCGDLSSALTALEKHFANPTGQSQNQQLSKVHQHHPQHPHHPDPHHHQAPQQSQQHNNTKNSNNNNGVGGGGDELRKPFKCSQCDYRSALQINVKQHMMTHVDIKPYGCSFPSCPFRSKWAQNVKEHERRVHGVQTVSSRRNSRSNWVTT